MSVHLVSDLSTPQEKLIRALEAIADVSDEQKAAINAHVTGTVRRYQAHESIARAGDKPDTSALIIEGFACRCHYLPAGNRQILSLHIPGDIPDVQSLYLKTMDHTVETIDRAEVLHIPHQALHQIFAKVPALMETFWRFTLIEASMFRNWISNIGQRPAYERIAHLLCETITRLKAVGLTDGKTCKLPLTQADIADATGLSAVHVNRSLQELRTNNLLQMRSGLLTVSDWPGLVNAAGFEPAYLHLRS